MHVDTKPGVVGEIPAEVVGVIVDDDVIVIPIPAVYVSQVERGDAEEICAESEAVWTTTSQSPDVTRANSFKVSMFPGAVKVKPGIAASGSVSNPFAIFVDMRGFGVSFAVAIRRRGRRFPSTMATIGRRSMLGHKSAADALASGCMMSST